METNNEKKEAGGFSYTYSAKEQAELKALREKYMPMPERENKLEHLRKLDAGVTKTALTAALSVGIGGLLVFGTGMSICMTDIGSAFGLEGNAAMIAGIAVGAAGAVLAAIAYPLYCAIVKRRRAKIAPEMIRLTDELLK